MTTISIPFESGQDIIFFDGAEFKRGVFSGRFSADGDIEDTKSIQVVLTIIVEIGQTMLVGLENCYADKEELMEITKLNYV